jgi:hypothetical protein
LDAPRSPSFGLLDGSLTRWSERDGADVAWLDVGAEAGPPPPLVAEPPLGPEADDLVGAGASTACRGATPGGLGDALPRWYDHPSKPPLIVSRLAAEIELYFQDPPFDAYQ